MQASSCVEGVVAGKRPSKLAKSEVYVLLATSSSVDGCVAFALFLVDIVPGLHEVVLVLIPQPV